MSREILLCEIRWNGGPGEGVPSTPLVGSMKPSLEDVTVLGRAAGLLEELCGMKLVFMVNGFSR